MDDDTLRIAVGLRLGTGAASPVVDAGSQFILSPRNYVVETKFPRILCCSKNI